ncbi:hypothetical protein GH714_004555 [Hevea brasiliensis]|uniref:Patatin n=1 Tax=Hevea brasiliensis TaxID=3981 RepID=A0A6A6L0M0_HEVBR|nr:hypothetical protein GH714_004555 [Hevea brasiliensis]
MALSSGKDAKVLKEELLEAIAPLDRGAEATPEDQQAVDEIARKLEAVNPTKEPLKSDLLNGKWELIYTTSQSILQTQRPKFLRSITNYQAINVDTLRAQNMESWPFFNQVTADLTPLTAKKVAVKFDFFKIAGLIPVKAPGRARGELEITYLDEELREEKKKSLTTPPAAINGHHVFICEPETPLSSAELGTSHPPQTILSSKSLSLTSKPNTQIEISSSNKDKLYASADSWKWRTKVSFFQGFLIKEKDVKSLKEELLDAIAPLDRGAEATPVDQERVLRSELDLSLALSLNFFNTVKHSSVHELYMWTISFDQIACKLEAANKVKEPLKSKLLNGKWELIYTTSQSVLQTKRPKLLRPNGKIYQAINVETLRAQNMETWPFFNQVTANLVPLNSRRVAVKFDFFRIAGLIPIASPGSGRGQLEITYLDEELRRVAVKFDFLRIAGLIPIASPGSDRGQLEITYLDEELTERIGAVMEDEIEPEVIWEQRVKDIEAEKERRVITSPGFSFSAAGLLFPYHLGVAQLLIEKGYIKETTPLAGSSAGAIVCAVIASGASMQEALQATKLLAEDCRLRGTAFRLGAVLRDVLEKFLPDDVHIRSNGRVRVAVTQILWRPRGLLVDQFDSKEDLINAVFTSSFIPGYLAPRPATVFRNRLCIDGGLTLFMPPTSAAQTVRVCAFPASRLGLEGIGISPDCNPENRASPRELFNWALEPAADVILDRLFELGYLDAAVWAEENPVENIVREDSPPVEKGFANSSS